MGGDTNVYKVDLGGYPDDGDYHKREREILNKTFWSPQREKYLKIETEWVSGEEMTCSYKAIVFDSNTNQRLLTAIIGYRYFCGDKSDPLSFFVCWTQDGKRLIVTYTSSGDNDPSWPQVTVVNLEQYSTKFLYKYSGLGSDVLALSFVWSSNYERLALKADGSVHFLDGLSGQKISVITVSGELQGFSGDSNYIVVKKDGQLYVYPVNPPNQSSSSSSSQDYGRSEQPYRPEVHGYLPPNSAGIPSQAQDFIPGDGYPGWS